MGQYSNVVIGSATISVNGTDLGFTKEGIQLRKERDYVEVMADQVVGLVEKQKSLERFFVKTTLIESLMGNLSLAWDEVPTSGTLTLGSDTSLEHTVEVVGKNPAGTNRTYSLDRAISIGTGEVNHARDAEVALEVEFECLKDNSGNFGTVIDS